MNKAKQLMKLEKKRSVQSLTNRISVGLPKFEVIEFQIRNVEGEKLKTLPYYWSITSPFFLEKTVDVKTNLSTLNYYVSLLSRNKTKKRVLKMTYTKVVIIW